MRYFLKSIWKGKVVIIGSVFLSESDGSEIQKLIAKTIVTKGKLDNADLSFYSEDLSFSCVIPSEKAPVVFDILGFPCSLTWSQEAVRDLSLQDKGGLLSFNDK